MSIYDPKVTPKNIEKELIMGPKLFSKESQEGFWSVADSIYESVENADAIVILTEWDEFKHINWSKCSKIMRSPSWLFDTRSVADYKSASTFGINIWRVGLGK